MKRDYAIELLTHELLHLLKNENDPYKACKKYLNMAVDVGINHLKYSQANQPKRKAVVQMTMLGNYIEDYISVSEASRATGIPTSNISRACLGINKSNNRTIGSSGGFKWKYKS